MHCRFSISIDLMKNVVWSKGLWYIHLSLFGETTCFNVFYMVWEKCVSSSCGLIVRFVYLWGFFSVIFKEWFFRSAASNCCFFLFVLMFVHVKFLSQVRVIKFQIKFKYYIYFQTFCPFVYFFRLLISFSFLILSMIVYFVVFFFSNCDHFHGCIVLIVLTYTCICSYLI